MTPQQIEAMKLALEALHYCEALNRSVEKQKMQAITAINEALAEHAMRETQRLGQEIEQEPVGVVHHKKISSMIGADYEQVAVFFRPLEPLTQLYASPPQRKPLTNEEIDAIADEYLVDYRIPAGCALNFARDIEAAHGIKENT